MTYVLIVVSWLGVGNDRLGQQRVLGVGRTPAFHLDGRNPVPDKIVGTDVPWAVAVAAMASGATDACQRGRLRHLCRSLRLIGGDLRHHRQDRAA